MAPEPLPPVGYLSRKSLPIKRMDAEPLTREDLQYGKSRDASSHAYHFMRALDFLFHVFDNNQNVFHSPQGKLVPFRQLYLDALYSSNKCSKVLKDRMTESPAFGIEFSKIALLVNVARINTTMAFFPEMKTALRTYHPVPSLQKTDGNAQDAPRIKNCLKAALLPSEFKSVPPSTPDEIIAKRVAGLRPPTSVVNLIFVLYNHAAPTANRHFDGTINFLDLFLPKPMSSPDRANAFLWLIYHYLEDSVGPNPFDDAYSAANKGKAPAIKRLTKEDQALENVDTPEEKEFGKKMTNIRNDFLTKLVMGTIDDHKKTKDILPQYTTTIPPPPKPGEPYKYYIPDPEREMAKKISKMRGKFYHKIARITPPPGDERSMLDQAWHVVMNHDPLEDSSEESQDEGTAIDYSRRLSILTQLRARSPTPDLTLVDDEPPRFRRDIEWD
ncbi:hypothetical protein MIND_00460000 [Mycena indigotica]|uniref:Ino eighty subunit 1 n=1 Tax=Mycena indigotica TaxID=2126181 RepID=A0A8H6SWQ6_9AGAR|nr:uncharacterized protein MIND_00460000 [Mycena indigotica]KAF7306683.1 hypothetical protein MIND_00460000 [Mycena indigotica]